ncbi:MAG TPA: GNAT family N-acetyltransferase, partial [Shewanella frigidimarina]|nr:GNAT family N-acetyltransferase [Shewanella frigidimarina]
MKYQFGSGTVSDVLDVLALTPEFENVICAD